MCVFDDCFAIDREKSGALGNGNSSFIELKSILRNVANSLLSLALAEAENKNRNRQQRRYFADD